MVQLLANIIGAEGIPLSYLIRYTRRDCQDMNVIPSLQDRRTATKMHFGNSFDIENEELFRILSNTLSATTIKDIILIH